VLVNQYQGRVPVHHVDAYRTDSLTELIDLGLLELMGGPGVTVIEWATSSGRSCRPRRSTCTSAVSATSRGPSRFALSVRTVSSPAH